MKASTLVLPSLVAAVGVASAGVGLVSADTTSSATTSSTSSSTAKPADNGPQQKDGGVITTDATVLASVKTAVEAKTAGSTIDRVAKLPDGSYLAFTRNASDAKVIVSLDSSFAITTSKDVPAGAPKDGAAPSSSSTSSSSTAN